MKYKGNPVSKGLAVGEVFLYRPFSPDTTEALIREDDADNELARYEAGKTAAGAELEKLIANLNEHAPDKAKIFQAHLDILNDVAVHGDIKKAVRKDQASADWAVYKVYTRYMDMLLAVKDELVRERAADMQDVRNRLLRNLKGLPEVNLANLGRPVIVAAQDLFPSDTASLDRDNVLGIITEVGGTTSHTAIIARSYGLPALLGVKGAMDFLRDGETVIVDAVDGALITSPGQEELAQARNRAEEYRRKARETALYIDKEPVLADGGRIKVKLNIGGDGQEELAGARYSDGVGLFRTEFVYMRGRELPSEEEQYKIYRKVLMEFGDKPVILRTLDIGGDKQCACLDLPREENPFLGKRALRLCFDLPEVFHTQLRAALRAGVHGNLWIMFPMVAGMDDLRRARKMLDNAAAELAAQGLDYAQNCKVGIMIEIPSMALMADVVAREVDFASIGTNDLCQYALAVDRTNQAVCEYFQMYHPGVLRLIRFTAEAFKAAGKPLSVCGDMGGDPLALPLLIGFGINEVSMGLSAVAPSKKIISALSRSRAGELAARACSLSTSAEVESYLRAELAEYL